LCSPNNPTANDLRRDDLLAVIKNNPTKIVVVDEAYVDFSDSETLAPLVDPHPNLIVLQTLSKAFGLAGVRHVVFFSRAKQSKQRPTTKILPLFSRLGMAIAHADIAKIMNKVRAPYSISKMASQIGEDPSSFLSALSICSNSDDSFRSGGVHTREH